MLPAQRGPFATDLQLFAQITGKGNILRGFTCLSTRKVYISDQASTVSPLGMYSTIFTCSVSLA